MLTRLETDGPNPVQAAEELDRLQGALERAGKLDEVVAEIGDLCDAWASDSLRGDKQRAWLVLVGSFGLDEHEETVARLVGDNGAPVPPRIAACRVLASFKGDQSVAALLDVVTSRTDPQVRAAAAEALAEIGDRSACPRLEPLLEDEMPRTLWNAISAAVDRLR